MLKVYGSDLKVIIMTLSIRADKDAIVACAGMCSHIKGACVSLIR